MNIEEAYDLWAEQYDSNNNETRDLEGICLRESLASLKFNACLEIGCGTGKNTEWLLTKTQLLTSIDLSYKMLSIAKEKFASSHVNFLRADINEKWSFTDLKYDLVTFSLILEHIENLDFIFQNVANVLNPGGYAYVGELHPFKQYSGTRARFETTEGRQEVTCFTHHISDFIIAAEKHGLEIERLREYFDDEKKDNLPRILTIIFRKK